MRIVDAGGEEPEPRIVKDFDASDISDAPFGWNLPNWLLRREMVARLAEIAGGHGMRMTLCTQPELEGDGIGAAKCIDLDRLSAAATIPPTHASPAPGPHQGTT